MKVPRRLLRPSLFTGMRKNDEQRIESVKRAQVNATSNRIAERGAKKPFLASGEKGGTR